MGTLPMSTPLQKTTRLSRQPLTDASLGRRAASDVPTPLKLITALQGRHYHVHLRDEGTEAGGG